MRPIDGHPGDDLARELSSDAFNERTFIGAAIGGILVLVVALIWLLSPASADPVHHHPGQSAAVDKFYSTWKMPDRPDKGCCDKTDCYATEVKYENERWYMKRREDGAWLRIPPAKIERNRDNPDARAHICAPPPGSQSHAAREYAIDGVFCASLGSGS